MKRTYCAVVTMLVSSHQIPKHTGEVVKRHTSFNTPAHTCMCAHTSRFRTKAILSVYVCFLFSFMMQTKVSLRLRGR